MNEATEDMQHPETIAVYKYQLSPYVTTELDLPVGVRFLHVATQGDDLCLWALVDTTPGTVEARWSLIPVPTGLQIPTFPRGNTLHVGTASMDNGFVVHMFAVRKEPER